VKLDSTDIKGKPLTPKEASITPLISAGMSNKEIGNELGCSEKTVKFHLTNIFKKLGVANRLQLAVSLIPENNKAKAIGE